MKLIQSLKDGGVYSLKELLGDGINYRIQSEVFIFLNDTGLVSRILRIFIFVCFVCESAFTK